MVRGFTKLESLGATVALPFVIWACKKLSAGNDGFRSALAAILFLMLIPVLLLTVVRLLFIWP